MSFAMEPAASQPSFSPLQTAAMFETAEIPPLIAPPQMPPERALHAQARASDVCLHAPQARPSAFVVRPLMPVSSIRLAMPAFSAAALNLRAVSVVPFSVAELYWPDFTRRIVSAMPFGVSLYWTRLMTLPPFIMTESTVVAVGELVSFSLMPRTQLTGLRLVLSAPMISRM